MVSLPFLLQAADDELAVLHRRMDLRDGVLVGVDDLRGHDVFELFLNGAAQIARAVGRGVGLLDEVVLNILVPRKVQALVLTALLQLIEHDAGDAGEVLLVKAVEADDLVHTVQEFGAQELAERLHSAVAVLLVHRVAKANGALLAFAARVGRHHDDGVFKVDLAAVGVGIIAVVLPGSALNVISSSAFALAPGYMKLT